jgi:hypothetical protein
MSSRALTALVSVGLVLPGCGGDGGDDAPDDLDVIAAAPAQGTVAGVTWTVGSRSMHVTEGELWVDLYPDAGADCTIDRTAASYPWVIFFTPAAPGRYQLGELHTATFVDAPSSNLIVFQGVIQIDAVTATTVSGGLHVFDSEFGEVDGRFDGALCYSQ